MEKKVQNTSGTLVQSAPMQPAPVQIEAGESKEGHPELGLVCITASNQVRYRALTRKRLLQLSEAEQAQTLQQLYADNLNRLSQAIAFCQAQQIHLYRLTSALLPFADQPIGQAVKAEFREAMQNIGIQAATTGLRIVLHPDQYVVLSSDRSEVIENSIQILATHAEILDDLGLPRSPWSLLNIHGGKGDRAERLIRVIQDLPDAIRSRLTLENDEYAYSAAEILQVCRAADIPMVFDAHHHVIHEQLDNYEDESIAVMLEAARSTWKQPQWQLVHISNGRASFRDPHHSDLITRMPSAFAQAPWIEVEAKLKEQAIDQLRQTWLAQLG